MAKLFLLFALFPILEIAILLNVSEQIGGWYTVAIVILTAFLGARLVKQEGLSTLTQAQTKMQQGQVPGQEMAEGLLLVIAGVLLITPGFVTDGIGFILSLPITRPLIAKGLLKHIKEQPMQGPLGGQFNHDFNQQQSGPFGHNPTKHSKFQAGEIIEGEFVEKGDASEQLGKPKEPL